MNMVASEHKTVSNPESFDHMLEDDSYRRIDKTILEKYAHFTEKNAVHGTMSIPGGIEIYHIFQKGDAQEIACIIRVGEKLCGHPGVIHGGVVSTLFDNSFGWLFFAVGEKAGFTANLNVNFRRPICSNSVGVMKVALDRREGRKTYVKATWEIDGQLSADATALFVKPKAPITENDL
jgi:uncharacterized protein (TIGR00369 family)